MISPYADEICYLRETVIDRIEDVDYKTVEKSFDSLSKLYFLETIFYSERIDEIKDDEEKERLLVELSLREDDWRQMIELQEKWGTIN